MARRLTDDPVEELTFEPSPRWVRGELGGETVVDSHAALVVWEPGRPVPLYAFPARDLADEALAAAEPPPEHSHPGAAEWWDLRAGGRVERHAAWRYDDPDLAGAIALRWSALDRWLEEDEEVFVHPRDPHKRVDALQSSRHVRVDLEGETLAESGRPVLLFESNLPVRYYLPREDVRMDALTPSSKQTRCPYKGTASYWSAATGGRTHEDIAWTYPDPIRECPQIRDLVCFFNERTDITVDGEVVGRPDTHWSPGVRENLRGGLSGTGTPTTR
jgi:uncharacterized protein (DUF427 family)